MASFLDVCRFNPTSNGTGSFVVSSAVNGYQTPALAGAVDGATYRYRAESADLTQWEVGTGVYTVSTITLTRATALYNSSGTGTGTGQSGAGTKISFTLVPQVGLVLLADDLVPGQIIGTPTNDNAAAGNVGEYISSSIPSGSAVALSNGISSNITSIPLTAGDWDVSASPYLTGGATTILTNLNSSISTASATLQGSPGQFSQSYYANTTPFSALGSISAIGFGPWRVSLSTPTTIFLVANAIFTVSTLSAYGIIRARRVR
jgi:hypothetical protein